MGYVRASTGKSRAESKGSAAVMPESVEGNISLILNKFD